MAAVEAVLLYDVSSVNSGTEHIDLAQSVSILNRKMERQNKQWVVESVELAGFNGEGGIYLWRLGNTWPVVNALVKGQEKWREQQNEAAREAGVQSTKAKYRDFKVFMDGDHANAGTGANLLPENILTAGDAALISPSVTYDWSPSQVVLPNTAEWDGAGSAPIDPTEYYVHVLGGDNAGANPSRGLIKAYAQSRARPQGLDPNVVNVATGGLFGEMEDVGNDDTEIIDNYQDANNEAPYYNDINTEFEFYPGGENQGNAMLIQEHTLYGGNNVRSLGAGFVANAGLIKLTAIAGSEFASAYLKIRMSLTDKGYLTRPMTEGN